MNPRIGFTTGSLHRLKVSISQKLRMISDLGCDTVELGFVKSKDFSRSYIDEIKSEDLEDFNYVSLHAPVIYYGHNTGTRYVFDLIKRLDGVRPLDLVIFHPNTVLDFEVFSRVGFSVAFENMDARNSSFKMPQEFEPILARDEKFKLVLDVNHIFSNDASMALAKEFYDRFRGKIVQIHLSGYQGFHDPLFKTKQSEIIRAIEDLSVPIIIESILDPKELSAEIEYAKQKIKELSK